MLERNRNPRSKFSFFMSKTAFAFNTYKATIADVRYKDY